MHFASSLTTVVLAAQANAAALEASDWLAAYESQYGLGLGGYASGPTLPPLDYGYSAPVV